MKARQGQKIVDGAKQFLEDGEQVLAGIVAAARGHTQAVAGVRGLGPKQQAGAGAEAAAAGLALASPMGLVVTDRRLMTLRIGTPWGRSSSSRRARAPDARSLADALEQTRASATPA